MVINHDALSMRALYHGGVYMPRLVLREVSLRAHQLALKGGFNETPLDPPLYWAHSVPYLTLISIIAIINDSSYTTSITINKLNILVVNSSSEMHCLQGTMHKTLR